MRSCDIHNLQFESEYNQELKQHLVKEDSIRLVCPFCKYQHKQEDKKWMNINGGFIHKVPERKVDFPRLSNRGIGIPVTIFIMEGYCQCSIGISEGNQTLKLKPHLITPSEDYHINEEKLPKKILKN